MGDFLSFLPSIIGGIAGLFKGKKAQYANQMTPEQQKYYSQMLQMMMGNAQGNTQANQNNNWLYGNLANMYYPQQQRPQQSAAPNQRMYR